MASETWAAGHETRTEHWSPPGPWSGHTQTVAWGTRLTIDGDAFTLAYSFLDEHEASNRGRRTTYRYEYTGQVVRDADGSLVLRARNRVTERWDYYEPPEDMWTPQVERGDALPPGELADDERFSLRARIADEKLKLEVETI